MTNAMNFLFDLIAAGIQALWTFLLDMMLHTPIGIFLGSLLLASWAMCLYLAFRPGNDPLFGEDPFDEADYR